jgi:hypothetical protein
MARLPGQVRGWKEGEDGVIHSCLPSWWPMWQVSMGSAQSEAMGIAHQSEMTGHLFQVLHGLAV